MGKIYDTITDELSDWIRQQHVFFVATAPLAQEGHVNCSPKGLDTLRILGPQRVGYLDLTGSGAETIAHIQENGRLVFMFCAFEGPPKIVRLHGTGRVVRPNSEPWDELRPRFPQQIPARTIIELSVTRISDSCGYGVPRLTFSEERDVLPKWANNKSPEELQEYQRQKNSLSIDGLPAL